MPFKLGRIRSMHVLPMKSPFLQRISKNTWCNKKHVRDRTVLEVTPNEAAAMEYLFYFRQNFPRMVGLIDENKLPQGTMRRHSVLNGDFIHYFRHKSLLCIHHTFMVCWVYQKPSIVNNLRSCNGSWHELRNRFLLAWLLY